MNKNRKFYFPYLITCIVTVAMYYIMCSVAGNEGLKKMPGHASLISILSFGTGVIGIFAFIFLFYTNSFLMKRRKKELGLYNILGMEKRHISKVLFFETIYLAIVSLVTGLLAGILLDKLITMLLYKMLSFSVPMGFSISKKGILQSLVLFAVIFCLILLSNLIQIGKTKPIDLLHGGNIGEKEPKAKWFLVVVGVISIGVAYYVAITTESPVDAISLFFIAVILVMVGTYCLFTAGSIAVLKLLKAHKKYYYQTKHFISISGMMYRMKQNAIGLANICILSTMVLVMVSTTVCLYIGGEEEIDYRYPYDINLHINSDSTDFNREEIVNKVKGVIEKEGRSIEDFKDILVLSLMVKKEDNIFKAEKDYLNGSNVAMFGIITEEQYAALTGKAERALEKNEVRIYTNVKDTLDEIILMETKYKIKENLDSFPEADDSGIVDAYYMVVKDNTVLREIYKQQKKAYGEEKANFYGYEIGVNIDGTKEEKIECADAVKDAMKEKAEYATVDENGKEGKGHYYLNYMESKQSGEDDFYSNNGGFLFLGIFLGILFLMATALIIYYKQISEGYDDKEKFEIMEKVGMTKEEVKVSIRSQVLKIFFLPIVAAGIHVAAAFPMITRLLMLFGLLNKTLFALCTIGTIVVFAIIYGIVYTLTARVYYKIVS